MATITNLFHYAKADEHLFNNLINSTLWFASPQSFNDPYDCKAPMIYGVRSSEDLLRQVYDTFKERNIVRGILGFEKEDFITQWKTNPELIETSIHKEITKYLEEESGIFCLSELPDNIKMWSHYAGNHSGVCLEFDVNKFIIENETEPYYYKVNYPNEGTYQNFLDVDVEPRYSFIGQLLTKSHQ